MAELPVLAEHLAVVREHHEQGVIESSRRRTQRDHHALQQMVAVGDAGVVHVARRRCDLVDLRARQLATELRRHRLHGRITTIERAEVGVALEKLSRRLVVGKVRLEEVEKHESRPAVPWPLREPRSEILDDLLAALVARRPADEIEDAIDEHEATARRSVRATRGLAAGIHG